MIRDFSFFKLNFTDCIYFNPIQSNPTQQDSLYCHGHVTVTVRVRVTHPATAGEQLLVQVWVQQVLLATLALTLALALALQLLLLLVHSRQLHNNKYTLTDKVKHYFGIHPKIWCLNFKPLYLQTYSSPTNNLALLCFPPTTTILKISSLKKFRLA